MKWSDGLNNIVNIIIRIYIDYMKFAAYMADSFVKFFHILRLLFF
jgi:hypothetical protein